MKKLISVIVLAIMLFSIASADTMRNGSTGEDVRIAQQRLLELGYLDDGADGKFGNKTAEAVKWFQSWNVMEVTGEIDDATYKLLMSEKAMPFPKTLKITPEQFVANLSNYRKAISYPGITYTLEQSQRFSRAVRVSIDQYTALVMTQCKGEVVEFMLVGAGDGSTESGYDIVFTFAGALTASNDQIAYNECADLLLRIVNGEDVVVGDILYIYTQDPSYGSLLVGTPAE